MVRRKRRNWALRLIGWTLLLLVVCYLVVLPATRAVVDSFRVQRTVRTLEDMSMAQEIRLRTVEVFSAVWFLVFGACMGSFINVVAGRMPRGQSMLSSSRCPHCRVRIPLRDNLPIAGWLMLAGRCRTCHLPISPRYLIVELIAAAMFVGLAFVELLSGGANLPSGSRYPHYNGFVWIIFYTKWDMIRLYAYHGFLLCALLAIALMRWDRLRIAARFVLICLTFGLLLPAVWPDVHPVLWDGDAPRLRVIADVAWWSRFDTSLIGLAVGTAWGAMLGLVYSLGLNSRARMTVEFASCLGLTGLFLGWQAAISVSLIVACAALTIALLGVRWPRLTLSPPSFLVLAAVLLQLLLWRPLSRIPFWPAFDLGLLVIIAECFATLIVLLLAGRLEARHSVRNDRPTRETDDAVPR